MIAVALVSIFGVPHFVIYFTVRMPTLYYGTVLRSRRKSEMALYMKQEQRDSNPLAALLLCLCA